MTREETNSQTTSGDVRDAGAAGLDGASGASRPVTEAEAALIREEERVAEAVRASLEAAASAHRPGSLPDARAPYFARMRVVMDTDRDEDARPRDILLGAQTYADARRAIRIIDWQTAPLARVFFAYRPGDEFAEEVGERELSGRLEQQSLVTFVDGHLVGIVTPEQAYHRGEDGTWLAANAPIPVLDTPPPGPLAALAATANAPGATPLTRLMGLLDADQRNVVEDTSARPLLCSGSAGTGKTTAALLRLAAWHGRTQNEPKRSRALMVVPEPGLARAARSRLEHFGIGGIGVETFDDWVAQQGRQVFRKLPARTSMDTPPAVSTLKRHPALYALLPRFVEALGQEMAERIDHALLASGRAAACVLACPGPTLRDVLEQAEVALVAAGLGERGDIPAAIASERRRLYEVNTDRVALVGDRVWLEAAMADAGGEITAHMVDATLAHTRKQLADATERAYRHVDADRLKTVDERSIDEGTSSEYADTIDVEDFALMFAILRRKTGQSATAQAHIERYRHMVIDEAQELTGAELAVLASARRKEALVTLAGDAAQQVSETARFASWEVSLAQAGLTDVRRIDLRHTYRCPQPIAMLAHQVLGPLAPEVPPSVPKDGPPVRVSVFPNTAHRAFALARTLMDLVDRAPAARIAIIASSSESARAVHAVLNDACAARLVENGEFLFAPGIDVTDLGQVKGLEFDVVIVPDASAAAYPDTPHARRRLHVALTRASHALWVIAVGALTPLIAPALPPSPAPPAPAT
ncbi:MAG TPA: ATP-binding domain-containing protein [Haliangium sp.]|nr:ATP-binding domain-containing protein [Haliangium sp.]